MGIEQHHLVINVGRRQPFVRRVLLLKRLGQQDNPAIGQQVETMMGSKHGVLCHNT
ncbi:MAG: hypothetical protein R2857_00840 [Vampirovibrionales bacterium]